MEKRILELAIEALEKRRAQVDEEIAVLRAELQGSVKVATSVVASAEGRRHKTAAERRAHSERMKKIWAARKATGAKVESAKAAPVKLVQDDAANQARSEKMRAYWAKKRAQKTKKSK
jgi:hypothetical protein